MIFKNILRKVDKLIADLIFVCSQFFFIKKNLKTIISISTTPQSKVKSRTSEYFNLIKLDNPEIKFSEINIRKWYPTFYYSLCISKLLRNSQCIVLFMDYHFYARFPTERIRRFIKNHHFSMAWWWETFNLQHNFDRILPTLEFIDFHLIADDPRLKILRIEEFKNMRCNFFPVPVFPENLLIKPESSERNINVSFFGATGQKIEHKNRALALEQLHRNGIEVNGYFSSSYKDFGRIPYKNMLLQLQNSKIGLNFSNHGIDGAITNRVFETIACGATLVSTNDMATMSFLTPNEDYMTFSNQEELVNLIKYLLNNSEIRLKLANSAQKKLLKYSSKNFINLCFQRLNEKNFQIAKSNDN